MEINIFAIDRNHKRHAIWLHLVTLCVAIVLNLFFWFVADTDGSVDAARTIYDSMVEVVSTIMETIVLMEASFAASALVIRLFWNRKYSFASLLLQNLILLSAVILISAGMTYVYSVLFDGHGVLQMEMFLCDSLIAYFLTSLFFTSYLTNRYRREKSLAQQVTIDKLKLKTDNHFVFNSLATLGNLIQVDPEAAFEFNSSMSRMYRYIVSKGDAPTVDFQEELGFIQEYGKNLGIRHDTIEIQLHPALFYLDAVIPPLTLQSLVENAVKHNRHGAATPLQIKIVLSKKSEWIIVSNTTQPLQRNISSTKTGLDTLNQRYLAISGREIKVVEGNGLFSVYLPVIRTYDVKL